MKTMVTAVMTGLLGMLLVSTAWGVGYPPISCDFESNGTVSTAAYPDTSTDADPDAPNGPFGSWSGTGEGNPWDVQVTSYGIPGAHGGSNYLRLLRSGGIATFSRLWTGPGNPWGGGVTIDVWLRSAAAGNDGQNEVWIYGPDGDGNVTGVIYGSTGQVSYYFGAWVDTGLSWTADTWQHLVLTLNLPAHTMDVSLDGNRVTGLPIDPAAGRMNQVEFTAPGGPGPAYFDDIVVANYDLEPLTGQVSLGDFGGDLSGVGLRVELRPADGRPVRTEHILLDANGRFTINNVFSGTYDIAIRTGSSLQTVIPSVAVTTNPTDIGIISFPNGNLNGDNAINTDLSIVLAHMDSVGDLGPGVTALDRGHRMLLRKGLQIEAMAYPRSNPTNEGLGDFDLPTWQASNFTGPSFETVNFASDYHLPSGMPWSRLDSGPYFPELTADELPYLVNMIAFQYDDEQSMDNATNRDNATTVLAEHRFKYPDVLGFTNQSSGGSSVAGMQAYMQEAKPDMLMFDEYPFKTEWGVATPAGGSPTLLYNGLAKYRSLSLAGNDGTGAAPIPFGQYLQTYRDTTSANVVRRFPSDSEMRLQQFAGWTFGCTFARAWVYNKPQELWDSVFFVGYGDTGGYNGTPDLRTPAFAQIAETNRQSRNLGKTLVRLLSTDVRFIAGLHGSPPGVANTLPTGVSAWSAGADPYITGISAANLGSANNGLRGDVLIGYFKPLLESDDGSAYTNQIYFMITNGLSDPDLNDNVSATRQRIQIVFNFGSSGITSLQRLSRESGLVETVPLTSMGGSVYLLTLDLDGGTGDLFKFNTGAPFIKAADYVAPPPNYFHPRISCDFDNNSVVSTAAYPDNSNGGNYYPDRLVDTVAGSGSGWIAGPSPNAVCAQVTSYGTPGAHSGSNYLRLNRTQYAPADARMLTGTGGNQLFGPTIRIDCWTYAAETGWNNEIDIGGSGNGDLGYVAYGPSNHVVYYNGGWVDTGLIAKQGAQSTDWQHLMIDLDLTAQKMSITLDGSTVSNLPFLASIAWVNQIDFVGSNTTAYFDDIVISQLGSTPMPGITLTGQIVLGDFSGDNASVGITVEFLPRSGGTVPLRTERVLLDSTGHFTVTNCIPDTYDVAIKADTWLKKLITNVNLNSSANLGAVTLVNGDLDGDNEVTSSDLAVVLVNMDLVGN